MSPSAQLLPRSCSRSASPLLDSTSEAAVLHLVTEQLARYSFFSYGSTTPPRFSWLVPNTRAPTPKRTGATPLIGKRILIRRNRHSPNGSNETLAGSMTRISRSGGNDARPMIFSGLKAPLGHRLAGPSASTPPRRNRRRFRPLGSPYRGNPGRALAALILPEFDRRQNCQRRH